MLSSLKAYWATRQYLLFRYRKSICGYVLINHLNNSNVWRLFVRPHVRKSLRVRQPTTPVRYRWSNTCANNGLHCNHPHKSFNSLLQSGRSAPSIWLLYGGMPNSISQLVWLNQLVRMRRLVSHHVVALGAKTNYLTAAVPYQNMTNWNCGSDNPSISYDGNG